MKTFQLNIFDTQLYNGDDLKQFLDDYEGLDRWQRIKELINDLNTLHTDEFHSIIMDANKIAKHNQDIFFEKN